MFFDIMKGGFLANFVRNFIMFSVRSDYSDLYFEMPAEFIMR